MLQIGFDVGGTNIKVGVVNDKMEIISHRSVPFPLGQPYENIVALMADLVQSMGKEIKAEVIAFKSIGIAIPGSIDVDGTTIINAHNLLFHNAPMKAAMVKYFPTIPVFLANDGNAATLAELHAGAFRGCKTAILITLGTGVGGGIVLGGQMFNGGMGHGIELGHMVIEQNGPVCTCGNKGCVEALCSATWLIKEGRNTIVEHPSGLIYKKAGGKAGRVTAKMVIDSAKEGDRIARKIFDHYVDSLSSAIVSCIVLLDPEVVALGGGVSLAGDFLIKPVREMVKNKSFFRVEHKVVAAELGNNAGIIGAAMLARNHKNMGSF